MPEQLGEPSHDMLLSQETVPWQVYPPSQLGLAEHETDPSHDIAASQVICAPQLA